LGDVHCEKFHDVIDSNVDLPHLTIRSDSVNRHDKFGLVSMDYDFQIISDAARSPAAELVARE
jgi:hypothetical protein